MTRYHLNPRFDLATLVPLGAACLPGWLGFVPLVLAPGKLQAQMQIRPEMLAPNGFLHAGSVVAFADTACGYATLAHLPEGAESFTTIELKSNFLGTATEGLLRCEAVAAHGGRNTQVWDAEVHSEAGRRIALFRCTQMILWPKTP